MLLAPLALFIAAAAAAPLDLTADVDRIAAAVLKERGTPSASVAVVVDGKLALAKSYGDARLEPKRVAAETRYPVASISKQFVAAAVLLLAEEGKLGLDDPVARFLPALTRSKEVKVRDLLAHTSGYQDYFPQDFLPLFMRRDVTPDGMLDGWAKKPLDFDPGTQWQYSNTGYVAAARIVEIASGKPIFEYLKEHIFSPLGMSSVVDFAPGVLSDVDALGYTRHGLSPLRAETGAGRGWCYGAGQLAMTASNMAKWNIAMIERGLLKPASYAALHREVLLKNGAGTNYGLGVFVQMAGDHRMLVHGGAVFGFLADNRVYPDERAAITVLTNDEVGDAAGAIAEQIAALLLDRHDGRAAAEARAREVFARLQKGDIDRAQLSENADAYFTPDVLKDIAASTRSLGPPLKVEQTRQKLRGGMLMRVMKVTTKKRAVTVIERDLPDGRIEQFLITFRT